MALEKKLLILSFTTLAVGLVGYFIFWNHWIKIIFAHAGALGLIGLLACLAGRIAAKKGFSYKKAFFLGFFPPIVLGIVADYLVDPPRPNGLPSSCGGVVSLGVVFVTIIIYSLAKSRTKREA